MTKGLELCGKKFGHLTVLNQTESTKGGKRRWCCQCRCGKTTKVTSCDLTTGHTRSCGCIQGPKGELLKDKIMSNVEIDEDTKCWLWKGTLDKDGYPRIWSGKDRRGHRISYKLHKGNIPASMCVCHTCDVRRCLNPEHLFLASNIANTEDRYIKGRSAKGEKSGVSKLKRKEVIEIKKMLFEKVRNYIIAEKFNISQDTVSKIKRGKTWRHVPEGGPQ